MFRKAKPLIDPYTNELLAYEAQYLGSARVVAAGEPAPHEDLVLPPGQWRHPSELAPGEEPWMAEGALEQNRVRYGGVPATLSIITAIEEIGSGDRVLASEQPRVFSHVPRAPEVEVEGRLIDIYRGVEVTGRHNVITLNVGARDGIETGHVLALFRNRGDVVYTEDRVRERFDLPQSRYGLVFVFRVFDRVAYGLVMDSDGPVRIGDFTRNP